MSVIICRVNNRLSDFLYGALAFPVKKLYGLHLIPEEIYPYGVIPCYRINIKDIPPDGKLSRPLALGAPFIPQGGQGFCRFFKTYFTACTYDKALI